ncbi:MAG: hypothetical protein FWC57_06930, partial [Endomicrobia bacterium]|nr:hypothetical protein [Endomicrobiia bacterium]
MKLWKIFGCLPIVFFIFGCKEKENNAFKFSLNGSETVVSLVKIENNVFDIKAVTHLAGGENIVSVRRLNYPVYRFECADITGDGIPEIAVGVIKPNHLDPKPDKR